ncbi:hypothetical protein [Paenibacillus xylanexedens]|uniref:hypothetical protein n=1 Tax=Paenibacillus xylanexedens TaxID=528191 RepID=UPI001643B1D8|nr:hypothetical protein [Paenibacillus xylanexedens]
MAHTHHTAVAWLEKLHQEGLESVTIAEYVLLNYMSTNDACEAMEALANDNDIKLDEEE